MALTLAEANQVMKAAIEKAAELHIRVSVAVCDAGGRLMAFNRMDGAIWAGAYGSQGKAVASAALGPARGGPAEPGGRPVLPGIAPAAGGPLISTHGAAALIPHGAV